MDKYNRQNSKLTVKTPDELGSHDREIGNCELVDDSPSVHQACLTTEIEMKETFMQELPEASDNKDTPKHCSRSELSLVVTDDKGDAKDIIVDVNVNAGMTKENKENHGTGLSSLPDDCKQHIADILLPPDISNFLTNLVKQKKESKSLEYKNLSPEESHQFFIASTRAGTSRDPVSYLPFLMLHPDKMKHSSSAAALSVAALQEYNSVPNNNSNRPNLLSIFKYLSQSDSASIGKQVVGRLITRLMSIAIFTLAFWGIIKSSAAVYEADSHFPNDMLCCYPGDEAIWPILQMAACNLTDSTTQIRQCPKYPYPGYVSEHNPRLKNDKLTVHTVCTGRGLYRYNNSVSFFPAGVQNYPELMSICDERAVQIVILMTGIIALLITSGLLIGDCYDNNRYCPVSCFQTIGSKLYQLLSHVGCKIAGFPYYDELIRRTNNLIEKQYPWVDALPERKSDSVQVHANKIVLLYERGQEKVKDGYRVKQDKKMAAENAQQPHNVDAKESKDAKHHRL